MKYGLDTNVLVRYLLNDDKAQAALVRQRIQQAITNKEILFISLLTILETEWVLRSYGKRDKATIIQAMQALLETQDVEIELEESLEQALHFYKNSNADFADCLMASRYQREGCKAMLTFDSKAAKLPNGELLGESLT
ncbi:MAG: type II toxin-antitoxin system VapC family toxin [Thiofilum sp.]|uniref:PIN domain-containing protein n=1 Tax=Thiofilum sp. TaxID=2212733 RepID=UPI0025F4B015|nr:type II toxin-antitoxin system VapC family toxin [Thiofilum sp.]MBK8452443.1 type II toxin-antitoxin system VapC family toxin [Thiofilum sp.]